MRSAGGKIVLEGDTRIWIPENTAVKRSSSSVFYNPEMELARDISIAVLNAVTEEKFVFLDALAGSGARGIRVANELGLETTLNDWNELAYRTIRKNAELNGLNVEIKNENAKVLLSESKFDVVDIDPFGSPAVFLDAACYSARKILCVTATDTAPLSGAHPASGLRKYSARTYKTDFYPEIGMRTLLGKIARSSSPYDKFIEPLLSHATRHYFRTYLSIKRGKRETNKMMQEIGFISYCKNCLFREYFYGVDARVGKICPRCGDKTISIGPLWLGRLHDRDVIEDALQELELRNLGKKREARKILERCKDEMAIPCYYDYHIISKVHEVKLRPIEVVIKELKENGYGATRTHFSGTGIKTDAGIDELVKVMGRSFE